jgi:cation transport ATPase
MKPLVKVFMPIVILIIVFTMIPWVGGGYKILSLEEAIKFFAQALAVLICGMLFALTFSRRYKEE